MITVEQQHRALEAVRIEETKRDWVLHLAVLFFGSNTILCLSSQAYSMWVPVAARSLSWQKAGF